MNQPSSNTAPKRQGIFSKIRSMDLTTGNLFFKLVLFALPMALTTILQLLYTTVDLVSVHYWGGGENSASAISGNGALINLIVVMFSGISVGANVAIGNAVGAKRRDHAQKVLHTSMIFGLITGIVVGLFGFFCTPFFLKLIDVEPAYLEEATQYMRIYFVGMPVLMVFNYAAQVHRAIGDSSTPFFALLLSGLLNVLFDFLFVYVWRLNVAGVAWATVISEATSAFLLILSLFLHKKAFVHLEWKQFKIDPSSLGEIVKLGLPAGLQCFFFALPNTFIQAALYDIGTGNVPLQNGAIAANNINNFNYAFIEAFASATMAFTAQNFGAKKKENIRKVLTYGLIWVAILEALYSLLIAFAYQPLLSLFVDGDNTAAIMAGRDRLWIVGFTYILDGIMDVTSGSMKGMRHPLAPAIITALTCTVFRILMIEGVILRVEEMRTVLWLYSVYPFSWILAVIADSVCLPCIFKKEAKKMEMENSAN